MDEITFFIGMQARPIKTLGKQGVFFEPGPQHGEIVEDVKFPQVILLPADAGWQVLYKINDLTLA